MSMTNKQQRELFQSAIAAVYTKDLNEDVSAVEVADETTEELNNIERALFFCLHIYVDSREICCKINMP